LEKPVWSDGGGSRFHLLLCGEASVVLPGGWAEPTDDDTIAVDDHASIPSGGDDSWSHFVDGFVGAAGGDVGSGGIGHSQLRFGAALDRETGGFPVGDPIHIVEDPVEPEMFEPARGSW